MQPVQRIALKEAIKLEVRDREDAIASTRAACAPRKFRVATLILSVFHHPHETFFDSIRFRRVTRYNGERRDEF